MSSALIGLGSNLGDRRATLDRAIESINAPPQVQVARVSPWLATQPIGQSAGADEFLNGAALLTTTLPPEMLLARLQEIENQLGRRRGGRWEQRTIDLDLLLYDELVCEGPPLELPHPRMSYRRFVLAPAAEIAGAIIHPTIGWSIEMLLAHLDTAFPYIAIRGPEHAANLQLATAVSVKTGWKLLDFPGYEAFFSPHGSTSLTIGRAIEFLRRQAALLTRESLPGGGGISSFWMDDVLAVADARWPGEFDAAWKMIAPAVVSPKLLVDFQPPADGKKRIWRHGIGPVLRLATTDPAAAEIELQAAIEAMS
jgi:2-amino-4-hydroxy-6-hydroxymethyldihydropteridine diphosphokinase